MIRKELQPEFLLNAYASGYFPMPDDNSPELMWFRPDPRAYFDLKEFQPQKSLLRSIRKFEYKFSFDLCFAEVMNGCSDRHDTWINDEFKTAYAQLHQLGFCKSVEVWHDSQLVGGLYGIQIGSLYCAESKFHKKTDASKAALFFLISSMKFSGMDFLEVQFMNDHLERLGARLISDSDYQTKLSQMIHKKIELVPSPDFQLMRS